MASIGFSSQASMGDGSGVVVLEWSLHTLKGRPVLKMACEGEHVYAVGEVVSVDDFNFVSLKQHTFRGTVSDSRVSFRDGRVIQYLEIAVEKHAMIDSGEYKPRKIATSKPPLAASPVTQAPLSNTPEPRAPAPTEAPKPGRRTFDFSEE